MRGRMLIERARDARKRAYAPYSGYEVGAALVTRKTGKVFTGANVENASYGATVCAERVAVWSALAAGQSKFSALAVVTPGTEPAPPCGMCLQVLSEFCDDLEILLAAAESDEVIETSLAELMPLQFRM